MFEALVGKQRDIFGEDDWYVVSTEHSLAELLYFIGDLQSAKRLQQHVLQVSVRLFGEESEQGQLSRINLANTLRELKEFRTEKPLRRPSLTMQFVLRPQGACMFPWQRSPISPLSFAISTISKRPTRSMLRYSPNRQNLVQSLEPLFGRS